MKFWEYENGWSVYTPADHEERFWNLVEETTTASHMDTPCWEIPSLYRNKKGYTRFHANKQRWYAHRYSYYITRGSIDPDLQVCHECDNPSCVNPNHLRLDTNYNNVQDRVKRPKR